MIDHGIEIPTPSRFIRDDVIDSIALQFNQAYCQHSGNRGVPLDVDRFMDWLEISAYWESFDAPDEVSCFARIELNEDHIVQINEDHKDLFESRPDVYRICLGHELGHLILNHVAHFSTHNTPSLFDDAGNEEPSFLHKNSWGQYGLTSEEVRQRQAAVKKAQGSLVKNALISPKAYQALNTIDDKFEPKWMFWQAEQFARCLAIPSDRLYEFLENEPLFSGWGSISRLAKVFEVSPGAMKTRLMKLKLIEMDSQGVPTPLVIKQESLLPL